MSPCREELSKRYMAEISILREDKEFLTDEIRKKEVELWTLKKRERLLRTKFN